MHKYVYLLFIIFIYFMRIKLVDNRILIII